MKRYRATLLAAALLAVAVAAEAASSTSFLSSPVPGTKELVKQVSKDGALAVRYAKHFGTTPAALISYIKENLRLGQLTRPYVATIYSIGENGSITKTFKTLAPGTKVFSTNWGEPVLEWSTGNPLVEKLPLPPKKDEKKDEGTAVVPASQGSKPVEATDSGSSANKGNGGKVETAKSGEASSEADPVVAKVLATQEQIMSPMAAGGQTGNAGASAAAAPTEVAALPTGATNVPAPVIASAPAAPVPAPSGPSISKKHGSGWALPLVLGGLAAMMGGGGSSGSSSGNPPSNPNNPPKDSPVPEPGSLLAISLGGLGAAFAVWRRRH